MAKTNIFELCNNLLESIALAESKPQKRFGNLRRKKRKAKKVGKSKTN